VNIYACDEICTCIVYKNDEIENHCYYLLFKENNLSIHKSKEFDLGTWNSKYSLINEYYFNINDIENFNREYIIELIQKLMALKIFS
jgi:hypothetical protein